MQLSVVVLSQSGDDRLWESGAINRWNGALNDDYRFLNFQKFHFYLLVPKNSLVKYESRLRAKFAELDQVTL